MTRLLSLIVLLGAAISQSGCVIACGPGHCPPRQKLVLIASSPTIYKIRVYPVHHYPRDPIDTPVGSEGRVEFSVPVFTAHCRQYLFGAVRLNPDRRPEAKRAIRVMRGDKTVRKLSVDDIATLPTDAAGYHILKIE